jgi:hypothetical protein
MEHEIKKPKEKSKNKLSRSLRQRLPLSWKILGSLGLPDYFAKPVFGPIVTSPSPSSSPIDPDRKASQKLISLITSIPLCVVKFEFFEDFS